MAVLEPGWQSKLDSEFKKPYMQTLRTFLAAEKEKRKIIYPKSQQVFHAFHQTPFDAVKVVIVGQDPYHGPSQAHGLCFSVQPGVPIPPSLRNMYQELSTDCGVPPAKHGCLDTWAKQGVLLLNSVLTVEQHKPGSHQQKGWETFTDKAIEALNREKEHLVFILWGGYAQKKGAMIDLRRHLVLQSVHPSPLSASRGFFGSKPFSQSNAYLKKHHKTFIDWKL